MYSVRLYHHEGLIWTESKAISPYGKRPAAGECRSGGSINTALKGVFPAHPVSEVNVMPKPKWNLNTIYISERLQESLGPISRCAMTTVVAPMGYGKTTAVNRYLAERAKTEALHIIRISVYSDNLAILWKSVQDAFARAGLTFCGTIPAPRIHELAGKKSCYIFVDDFHLLTDRRVYTFLCMLANRLPANVHLI